MRKSFQLVLLSASLVILLGVVFPAHSGLPFADSKNGVPTLAPLLQGVTPAVVNISVQSRSAIEDNPLFRDPFFRRFFNIPDQAVQQERSAGSGVIVTRWPTPPTICMGVLSRPPESPVPSGKIDASAFTHATRRRTTPSWR